MPPRAPPQLRKASSKTSSHSNAYRRELRGARMWIVMIRPGRLLAFRPCAVLLVFGQVQPDPPPAAAPTIRTTASEVLLDIVVHDKHGKSVRNLKTAEVQIFED